MAQTSYLTFNRNLAFPQGHAFTTYRPVTTRSIGGLVPPITILDNAMYDDCSDEFDSDGERSVFSRHGHRLLVERRARAPEDSKTGRSCLSPPTPMSTNKPSKGIDTSVRWDYAHGPLSPLSGVSESDGDSENGEDEKQFPAAEISPARISGSINRGEDGTSVSPTKILKRKRSSDSLSPPCNPESPSKRQRCASGARSDIAGSESGDDEIGRTSGINTCHVRPEKTSGVPDKDDAKVNGAGAKRQSKTTPKLHSVKRKIQTKDERKADVFGKIRKPRF